MAESVLQNGPDFTSPVIAWKWKPSENVPELKLGWQRLDVIIKSEKRM